MAGLAGLLRWQWRAYWRRILRGGTAARSNLVVLALIAIAGLARYITFLRDVAAANLEWLMAGLLLLCAQPGWDAAQMALGPRDMVRFPLTSRTRFALRVLSRFIAPLSWIFIVACIAGFWPLLKLAHPALAAITLLLLMSAAFDTGMALADLAGAAKGVRIAVTAVALLAALIAITHPWRMVILAGAGDWAPIAVAFVCAALAFFAALQAFPWMLRHSPRERTSRKQRSARRMTLLGRELRLHAGFIEVRTAWAICAALCVYLATADRPEPDALRVMLGVLAFLTIAAAMNSFGADGSRGAGPVPTLAGTQRANHGEQERGIRFDHRRPRAPSGRTRRLEIRMAGGNG